MGAVIAVLVVWAAWIGIRAVLARGELESAQADIEEVRSQVERGDLPEVRGTVRDLQGHASAAAGLTSDPLWRGAEWVPGVGPNLIAFREASGVVDDIAARALPPLVTAASDLDLAKLAPSGGRIDASPLARRAEPLDAADGALAAAAARAEQIPTEGTLAELRDAVEQLRRLTSTAADAIHGARVAADVLPGMLGSTEGPRRYLLLFQNNAELRASGGIPGVVVLLTADDGRLTLGEPVAGSSFMQTVQPIVPLTSEERTIFGDQLGEIMQDVTATPDFARTGELASAMWTNRFGGTIDGVVSIDPVALSYLLGSTGPVPLPDGSQLTAQNAVDLLLSQAYARFPDPDAQDAFFAAAAGSVFSRLTEGAAQPVPLVQALAKAVGERRLLVWSAREDEQSEIASTDLGGGLPEGTRAAPVLGVFLNDGTLAKMDYYLRATATLGGAVCFSGDQMGLRLSLRLRSDAPADAATALPPYVLGAFAGQVPKGVTRTTVLFYLPSGIRPSRVQRDGADVAAGGAEHDGRRVVSVQVDLEPGASTTFTLDLVAPTTSPQEIRLQVTPMATQMGVVMDTQRECSVP